MVFMGWSRVSVATALPLGWVSIVLRELDWRAGLAEGLGCAPVPQPHPHSESMQSREIPHGNRTPQKMPTITDSEIGTIAL